MRAAVLRTPGTRHGELGDLAVEDVELAAPRPGEARVRVLAAGVCGTELHYLAGEMRSRLPVVLGHEGVGVVEEVAVGADLPGEAPLRVGDRVAFTWRPRCGQCDYCTTGRPWLCVFGAVQASAGGLMDGTSRLRSRREGRVGEQLHHFLGVSCFAEEAVVSRRALVRLEGAGAEVDPRLAAVTGCAVVTGVGAVLNAAAEQAPVTGRRVLVIGAGGVGLSAAMGAVLAGAAQIVVLDVAADRLALARELGATDVVDAGGRAPDDVLAELAEATGGGADVAVDAVGAPATLAQAFTATRPGGTVVAVGLSSVDATVALPVNQLVMQSKRLVGSLYGSSNPVVDLPRLLALHAAGRLPLERLLGAAHPLEDVRTAFAQLADGSARGRAVVVPRPR